MQLTEMLKAAVEKGASDIFIGGKAVSGRDPPDDPGDL